MSSIEETFQTFAKTNDKVSAAMYRKKALFHGEVFSAIQEVLQLLPQSFTDSVIRMYIFEPKPKAIQHKWHFESESHLPFPYASK